MIRLTRRYRFSASHRLHSPALSPEENQAIYGKCNNPYGHGHDYMVEVSARGPVDPETGLMMDAGALDRLVENSVIHPFHMRHLNTQAAEFGQLVPTTENLAVVIESRLREAWTESFPGSWPRLDSVRIHETRRNIFELAGGTEL